MLQEETEKREKRELPLTPLARYADVQTLPKLITPSCR